MASGAINNIGTMTINGVDLTGTGLPFGGGTTKIADGVLLQFQDAAGNAKKFYGDSEMPAKTDVRDQTVYGLTDFRGSLAIPGVRTRAWTPGDVLKKRITLSHGLTTEYGSWHQFVIAEPEIIEAVALGATLRLIRLSNGERVPITIVSQTGVCIVAVVMLSPEPIDQVDYVLCAGLIGDVDGFYPAIGPAGLQFPANPFDINVLNINVKRYVDDEAGKITGMLNSVHWSVQAVPADSSFAYIGGVRVTHVALFTPFSTAASPHCSEYELPIPLYTTDDGTTWHVWPTRIGVDGFAIPFEWWGGTIYYYPSDPANPLFLANGSIRFVWRTSSPEGIKYGPVVYCDVSGTIDNPTIGATHTIDSLTVGIFGLPSPSFHKIGETWYAWGMDPTINGDFVRYESTDFETVEHPTFTNKVSVLPRTVSDTAVSFSHGQVFKDDDGSLWLSVMENLQGRIYRSLNATGSEFEPANEIAVPLTSADWCDYCYKTSIYRKLLSPGYRMIFTGSTNPVASPAMMEIPRLFGCTTGPDAKIGYEVGTGYIAAPPAYAAWDFAARLYDLSGNAHDLTIVSVPTQAAGAYSFDGVDDRLDSDFSLADGGADILLEIDAEIPADLSGVDHPICGDVGAATEALQLYAIGSGDDVGKLAYKLTNEDGTAYSGTLSDDVRGERHVVTIAYNSTTGYAGVFIDGTANSATFAITETKTLLDTGAAFSLGGYANAIAGRQFGHVKVYRAHVWNDIPARYQIGATTEYLPVVKWAVDVTEDVQSKRTARMATC
jgi:hypothetical protein